jgi:4-hydroxybenzoate polyprenyltransferase
MVDSTSQRQFSSVSRLGLFLALSRTPHGLLDMATPCLAALLWLGAFPPLKVVLVGILTVFAGYSAVYALNDVIDYRSDKKKMEEGLFQDSDYYLDGAIVRHPLARGLLGLKESLVWTFAWAFVAMAGAFILNPVCVLVFVGGCALEVIYCLLWKRTWMRSIVSGGVKSSGAIAALFAVDPDPSFGFLLILFLWLFFWEIGGQNIPNDWEDLEGDKHLQAKTIPVRFGTDLSAVFVMGCLLLVLAMNAVLLCLTPFGLQWPFLSVCLIAGAYLLIAPAWRLYKTRERVEAINLFNRASYYPFALLVLVAIRCLL